MRQYIRNIIIVFVSISFIAPFLYLGILSFSKSWPYPSLLPLALGMENWNLLMEAQSGLAASFIISVIISLTVAITATFLAFFVSRVLMYHRLKNLFLLFSYFPFVMAPVIYAVSIYYFFIKLGISATVPGVIAGQLLIAFPFAILVFSGFWNERMKSLDELVTTLGGTQWQAMLRVHIPVSKGILQVVFFQTFLLSWFEYGLTSILGVGSVQTLTVRVFQYINEANVYFAAAGSMLLIIPPVLLLWINKRFIFTRLV